MALTNWKGGLAEVWWRVDGIGGAGKRAEGLQRSVKCQGIDIHVACT